MGSFGETEGNSEDASSKLDLVAASQFEFSSRDHLLKRLHVGGFFREEDKGSFSKVDGGSSIISMAKSALI